MLGIQRMCFFLFLFFVTVSVVEGSTAHAESSGIANINVTAKLVEKGNHIEVRFQLKNNSSATVHTYASSTPWGNYYTTIFVLISPKKSQSPLIRLPVISDPPPDLLDISAGDTLSGNINLSTMFPDIDRSRKESDILVFWSYRLNDVHGNHSEWSGGMLVIKQK